MASDVASSDLNAIQDEGLLRKMWQETEDYGKKKEIRAHMYKLRENRLRDFYTGDMDAGIGLTKSPLTTSHGDSLAGQSFQSFKAKEIRDSASPTRDFKFGGSTIAPDTSGWNVVTSAEVSNDGRSEKLHSLATTGGSQEIPGGKSRFAGRNENLSTIHHDGDDKNFVTSMGQSSDTHLQESSVINDPINGRVESKSSATTTTSSSSRTISKQNESTDDVHTQSINKQNTEDELRKSTLDNVAQRFRSNVNVIDNNRQQDSTSSTTVSSKTSRFIQNEQESQEENATLKKTINNTNQQQQQRDDSRIENTNNSNSSTTRTIRSGDSMTRDQRTEEAFRLAALPGEILSRKVDYPNATTQMVTEQKRLEDGTVVTTTRYETRTASTEITATPSDKRESSTSRVLTEERASRNKTEVIYDEDKKNDLRATRMVKTDTEDQQHKTHRRNDSRSEIVIQRDDLRASVESDNRKTIEHDDRSLSTDYEMRESTTHRVVKKDLSAENERHHQRNLENIAVDTDRSYAPSEVSELSPRSHQTFDYNTTTTTSSTLNKDKRQEQDYHSNKRISVEVDSAHDSFARSLRSVSPSNTITNTRSTTTSQTSLRSTFSPEKQTPRCSPSRRSTVEYSEVTIESDHNRPKAQSPSRRFPELSPSRRHPSPSKSPEKVSQSTVTTKVTKKQETEDTIRNYETESARSTSPTCTVSDIEYHPGATAPDKKYSDDEFSVRSQTNNTMKKSSLKQITRDNTDEISRDEVDDREDTVRKPRSKAPYSRSETYEERCRQILGMDKKDSVDLDEEADSKPRRGSKPIEPVMDFIKNERRHVETQNVATKTMRRTDRSPTKFTSVAPDRQSPIKNASVKSSPAVSPERKPSTQKRTPMASPERKPSLDKRSPVPSPDRKPAAQRKAQTENSESKSIVDKVAFTTKYESVTKENLSKPTSRSSSPKKSFSPERIIRRPASPHTINGTSPSSNSPTRRNSKSPEKTVKRVNSTLPETPTMRPIAPKTIVMKPNAPQEDAPITITRRPKSPEKFITRPQTSPVKKTPLSIRAQSAAVTTIKTSTLCSRSASLPQRPLETSPTRKPIEKRPSTQDLNERRSSVKTSQSVKTIARKSSEVSPERKTMVINSQRPTIKTTSVVIKPATVSQKKLNRSESSSEDEKDQVIDQDENELLAKTITNKRFNKVLDRKDSAPVYRSTKTTETVAQKTMNRSSSENVMKSSPARNRPTQDTQPAEKIKPLKASDIRRPNKCITTKTINLSPKVGKLSPEDDDVIIDTQQAKSSREHSPNRMIPVPVSPEQDTGKPRFPDDVEEPEDGPRKKKAPKVKDMTIMEENTQEFMRCSIIEVDDNDQDATEDSSVNPRVKNNLDVTDDCMLSVSDKVSKFITSAEEVTKIKTSAPFKPDTDGPTNVADSDDCLMSVNEKVSKFITTAEEISKPKASMMTDDMPVTNINDKVAQFLETADKVTKTVTEKKTIQMYSPNEPLDEELREDECLLSVSDKVNKFATTVEKLQPSPSQKSPEMVAKIHRQVSLKDIVKTDELTEDEEEPYEGPRKGSITERYSPKEKPVTPTPIDLRRSDSMKRAKAVFEKEVNRDILTRPSVWEAKRKSQSQRQDSETEITTETTSESFYLTTPDDREVPNELDRAFIPPKEPKSVPAYMKDTVSSKKNIFEKKISSAKIETTETAGVSIVKKPQPKERSPTRRMPQQPQVTEKAPESEFLVEADEPVVEAPVKKKHVYTTPPADSDCTPRPSVLRVNPETVSAKRTLFENRDSPSPRANGTRPSYMSHTVASLEHIRKESVDWVRRDSGDMSPTDGNPRSGPKFGELENVEEIFDLDILEEMLETVASYEVRRRIRNQIRIVKKQIEESLQESIVTSEKEKPLVRKTSRKETRPRSPERKISSTSPIRMSSRAEQNVTTTRSTTTTQRTVTRDESLEKKPASPIKSSKLTTVTTTTTANRGRDNLHDSKEDKPIWAQKNILKKASENTRTTTSSKKVVDQKAFSRPKTTPVPQPKDAGVTDCCVTSSYGIGPTDDNGKPIFGLRALKKKKETPSGATVTGTIVQETYYSENGGPATGERKVTMYSNDKDQLKDFSGGMRTVNKEKPIDRENSSRNIVTVTKSQKIVHGEVEPVVTIMSTNGNILTRRGSVKEMSEKFIQKESEANNKTTNGSSAYPKAGLILRTQSTRSRSTDGVEEDETEDLHTRVGGRTVTRRTTTERYNVEEEHSDSDDIDQSESRKSTRTTTTTTRSFLNSAGEKVTGVNDVLERMRNADNVGESGDTEEDKEARALLNKFLGASVLMSGVEAMVPGTGGSRKEVTTRTVSGMPSAHQVTKTVTSRTVKQSGSAPVTTTTTVVKTNGTDIDEIVDEEILKKLLEQATNYEERRKIRSRIKQVMADKGDKKEVVVVKKEAEEKTESEGEESYEYVTDSEAGSGEEVKEDGEGEEEDEEEEVIEEEVTVTTVDPAAAKTSTKTTTSSSTTGSTQKGTETKSVSTKMTTKSSTSVQTKSSSSSSSTKHATSSSSSDSAEKKATESTGKAVVTTPAPVKVAPVAVAAPAKKEESSNSSTGKEASQTSGESLLLPLLQGLLHKNSSQRSLNGGTNEQNMSEMMVPQMEDSGTESGEDLRLLAAGLQNAMHKNSQNKDPKANKEMGLLEEVTAALERLETSLKAGADMSMHKGKKQNLLLLVSRLKTGLISPDKLDESPELEKEEPSFEEEKSERRLSGHGRFAKRRNRNNRHTVGVSREELADARQLMEDMMIRKSLPSVESVRGTTTAAVALPPTENYALQKQLSLGAVLYRPHQFVPEEIKKNTQALVKNTPQFPTPVTYYQEKKPKFKFIRQSMSLDQGPEPASVVVMPVILPTVAGMPNNRNGGSMSNESGMMSASKGILKVNGGSADARRVSPPSESSEEEFEPGQTNGFDHDGEEYNEYPRMGHNKPGYMIKGKDRRKIATRCRTPPGKLFDAPPPVQQQRQKVSMMMTSDEDGAHRKTQSKFSKKMRMKRANTIDIPKPFGLRSVSTAEDSDEDEVEDESMTQSLHQPATVGLKKTIDVGDKVRTKRAVPKFKPQTENDHKFLAFIQRQAPQQGTSWVNPNASPASVSAHNHSPHRGAGHNWNNKFGNIKNAFEKPGSGGAASNWGPATNANKSARNFWHKSEGVQRVENSKFPSIPPYSKPQSLGSHNNQYHDHPHQNSHVSRSKAAATAWKQRTMSQPEIMHYAPENNILTGSCEGLKIRDAEFVPPEEVEYFTQPLNRQNEFVSMSQMEPLNILHYQQQPQQIIMREQPIYQPQQVAVPKPVPVNQFSHNPMSAFKPIPRKIQPIPAFKPIEKPERVINNVKKYKENYNQLEAKARGQVELTPSPTRSLGNAFQKFSAGNSPVHNKSPTLPWTSKPVFENRVMNLATSKFDQGGKVSPRTQTMKFKSPTNSMISSFSGVGGYSPVKAPNTFASGGSTKMLEKRPSLPNTSYPFHYEDDLETMQNTRLNENLFTDNPSYVPMHQNKSDPPTPSQPLSRTPHSHSLHDLRQPEMPLYHALPGSNYVVTDYTPQSCVSTCVPTWRLTEPEQRDSRESITNPNGQPLVLTCNQPVYSPSQLNGSGYQEALKIFDFPSPIGGSSNNETTNDEWDDEPELTDSTEYKAVSSRVMTGPVQQTAVTVANKVKKRFDDEERDSKAAKNLHSVLKTIKKAEKVDPFKSNEIMGGKKEVVSRAALIETVAPLLPKSTIAVSGVPPQPKQPLRIDNMFSQYPVASVTNHQPTTKTFEGFSQSQFPPPTVTQPRIPEGRAPQKIVLPQSVTQPLNRSPLPPKSPSGGSSSNSLAHYRVPEIPCRSPQIVETPATPQAVPTHAVFNNVGRGLPPRDPQIRQSFTSSEASESRFQMRTNDNGEIRGFNVGGSALSKSDSWHQICLSQGKPPSPVPNRSVQRAKSNHNLLSLPKQYEGGIDREKLQEKQKTVSAYFGTAAAKTVTTQGGTKKTTINRIKTSEKTSALSSGSSSSSQKPSSGLCRSNTMPSIAATTKTKLDEHNIDDAFEDLFNTAMQ